MSYYYDSHNQLESVFIVILANTETYMLIVRRSFTVL